MLLLLTYEAGDNHEAALLISPQIGSIVMYEAPFQQLFFSDG